MQIAKAEVIQLKIPFTDGGKGEGLFITRWNSLDFVLLRLETDTGLVGWGDAFAYFCADSVAAMLRAHIVPMLIGRDPRAPQPIIDELERRLHIIGRYGVTMFAISGTDIALWDLAAKAENVPLGALIDTRRRDSVPAYASLVRYADDDVIARTVARALAEGYGTIKLHEIELGHIRAGRAAAGDLPLTNDVNCNWTVEQVEEWLNSLNEINLFWLEEPIWPPEGWDRLAGLRAKGLTIAAGENACTHWQFAEMIAKGAVDYAQPSVTKVGGISQAMVARRLAEAAPGVKLAMHSPYFGPGYLATLHLLSTGAEEELFEYLYIDREACLYPALPVPDGGRVAIPDGPGLGMDPDPDVIARYRV